MISARDSVAGTFGGLLAATCFARNSIDASGIPHDVEVLFQVLSRTKDPQREALPVDALKGSRTS